MKNIYGAIFFLLCTAVQAQNNSAYIIPRQIFVGDLAALIVPLDAASQNSADIFLTPSAPDFPLHDDIDIHRITLERRINGSRLKIEFTAFVPGLLELPAIDIGGERFSGLYVTVNSLIDSRSAVVLSAPASSLAIPGTAFMLYGTLAGFIILILSAVWFILKGRILMKIWKEKINRWIQFISMKLTEKRLYKSLLKGEDKRIILDKLSSQFRIFLSFLTSLNCCAMTAREFKKLPEEINPSFLENFFFTCDELRFSGVLIEQEDILKLLTNLRWYIGTLEKRKTKEEI